MIDPEEAARRAAEAELMAGEDVEPPPAAGEPGVPPTLREESAGAAGSAEGSVTVEHPAPQEETAGGDVAEAHDGAAVSPSAAGGPSASAGPPYPEAAWTPPAAAPPDLHPHPPGFAVADTPLPGTQPLPDAEDFIERAIESVLEQVPDVADEEPEGSAKLQPWAETAAPPSKNKRPLSDLLEQYAARVAAAPDAVAGRPRGQHPIAAFFARFTPQGGGGRGGDTGAGGGGAGRGRRRRGRRGAPEGRGAMPAPQQQQAPQGGGGRPPRGPRPQGEQRQPRPQAAQPGPPGGDSASQRRTGRRRGRRRGRGGGGGGGGAPAQP